MAIKFFNHGTARRKEGRRAEKFSVKLLLFFWLFSVVKKILISLIARTFFQLYFPDLDFGYSKSNNFTSIHSFGNINFTLNTSRLNAVSSFLQLRN